jgi:hypothetical protein
MNRHGVSFYAMVSLGIVLMLVLLAGAAFAGEVVVALYQHCQANPPYPDRR